MGMKPNEKVNRWIDLSCLSYSKSGDTIHWPNSIGCTMNFIYGKYSGTVTILDRVLRDKYKIAISTGDEIFECILSTNSIRDCQFNNIFMRSLAVTNPELVQYFINKDDAYKYPAHSKKKVDMICPLCGTVKKQIIKVLSSQGLGCSACSDGVSYPNKFMFNILTQLGIDFKNEVTKSTPGFEWIINNYRYDFYVEYQGVKRFIEMDGAFHTNNCFMSYENAHNIDCVKDKLALEHDIQVIRIDCNYSKIQNRFTYIKNNILDSEINLIFNLSVINWEAANNFSIDSNIKMAAELWKNNDYCVIDIGNRLGVSRDTARGYLKIAANLNLCDYNDQAIKERMKARISKNNKRKAKPIALYKNDNLINVFSGVMDLDRKSEHLYGVHIDFRNAYAVCCEQKKQAYGYTMKFISQETYEHFSSQFSTIQN